MQKNLKISYVVLMITLILVISSASNGQNKQATGNAISYDGFGPVKVGMTVSKASKALGTSLVRGQGYEASCYYVSPKQGFKGVNFMVTNNQIARIDISDKGYATDRGAKVGDTEATIKRLYKGLVKVSPHPYGGGHYLTVKMNGGKNSIIFETDGNRVTSFRAGKSEEVGYIEGCS